MIKIDEEKRKIIHDQLVNKEETVAVAESVTSGLLQWALASIDDATQFYQGGITVYNIAQKYRHLHIEPIHAMSCNCVSSKISEQMALQVCELFLSQWGIAVTGYAVPVPESGNKIFAFYAIAHKNKIIRSLQIHPTVTNPEEVQQFYAKQIIDAFVKCING
jgi:PncC family amidohydrolase